jgi:hypothetical protein
MSGIFEKLGFNFDTSKFGDAQYLAPTTKAYLNAAPLSVSSWMESDLANGTIEMTNYYQNPAANVCTYLTSNTNSIVSVVNSIINVSPGFTSGANAANAANTLLVASANLIVQIAEFKKHTDNVSGVTAITSNSDTIPGLDSSTNVGNFTLKILNSTDAIENTTPLLGCMTSLFIVDDLLANNLTIVSDYSTINSGMTSDSMNLIISHVNTVNSLMYLRRTSDWNFFANSYILLNDYIKVNKFSNLGNTQTYLINNLIGTDRLKQNLANTANT